MRDQPVLFSPVFSFGTAVGVGGRGRAGGPAAGRDEEEDRSTALIRRRGTETVSGRPEDSLRATLGASGREISLGTARDSGLGIVRFSGFGVRRVGACYCPTTRSTKVPGTTGARGWGCAAVGSGAGPKSAVTRKIR